MENKYNRCPGKNMPSILCPKFGAFCTKLCNIYKQLRIGFYPYKFKYSSNNANLKITKIDSKTKKPLPNVTFKLTDEKGANLGEYTTNQNGVIEIKI